MNDLTTMNFKFCIIQLNDHSPLYWTPSILLNKYYPHNKNFFRHRQQNETHNFGSVYVYFDCASIYLSYQSINLIALLNYCYNNFYIIFCKIIYCTALHRTSSTTSTLLEV